ncbi:MAG: tetratricopeptide repeat protein [Thermodesulfobacteriota bacterium]|nr:tetratricopeptide repeat protein [Thermodesulfobacteriota bacterium]
MIGNSRFLGGGTIKARYHVLQLSLKLNSLELNPGDADAYGNRGNAWRKKGNYNRAISNYNKAIELNPGDAKAYYFRAVVYKKLGQSRKVAGDYNNYLRINGNKDGIADQVKQKIRNLGYTPLY